MNILKSIRAWVAGLITKKEPVMADTPEVTTAPATTTDTELLKKLLLALGHDIEEKWDSLVVCAQKVV